MYICAQTASLPRHLICRNANKLVVAVFKSQVKVRGDAHIILALQTSRAHSC